MSLFILQVLSEKQEMQNNFSGMGSFLPVEVLEKITEYTNARLFKIRSNYNRESDVILI